MSRGKRCTWIQCSLILIWKYQKTTYWVIGWLLLRKNIIECTATVQENYWVHNWMVTTVYVSTYRVLQRKTRCFELLVWLGFWIIGHFNYIKLGVVLSSKNLCLINHLNLFWPQTASAASDKKCKNSKLFSLVNSVSYLILMRA